MPRRVLPALLAVARAPRGRRAPAAALTHGRAPNPPVSGAGRLAVPLDRTGRVPGTVKLSVAVEAPRKGADGFLLALSGGPGQPSVAVRRLVPRVAGARARAPAARPARPARHRRVGRAALPGAAGARRRWTSSTRRIVEACASALGPARQFYSTTDSVADIDALRQAIGAPKLAAHGRQLRHLRRGAVRAAVPGEHRRADPRLGRRPGRDRRLLPGHLRAAAARAAPSSARQALPDGDRRPGRRPRHADAQAGARRRCAGRSRTSRGARARDRDPRRVRAAVDHHVGRPEPVPAGGAAGRRSPRRRRRRGAAAAPAPPRAGAVHAGRASSARRSTSRRPAPTSRCPTPCSTPFADRWTAWRHGADGVARQRVRAVQPRRP